MKTLTELKKNTSEVTDNIIEGNFDLYDYCHEQADSDSRVIYYYQSKEYVLNHPDQSELEDEWKEYGFEFTDLNTLFTQLAFIGIKKELYDNCLEDIKKDLELFNDALGDLEQLAYELEDERNDVDLMENIGDIENAIAELEEYV